MHRRIHWLVPDRDRARRTMEELLRAGIEYRHIRFVGRDDVDMTGFREANVLQTSDVIRVTRRGLVLGVSAGCLAGIVAALFPVIGEAPRWEMIGLLGLVGGAFGAWTSSFIGVSAPNRHLRRYSPDIERGCILLMIDVPTDRIDEINHLLRALNHEAGAFVCENGSLDQQ